MVQNLDDPSPFADLRICLENVGRNFQSKWAVRDVSAEFRAGETIAILGSNGAGKSTLLRLTAGWFPLATGAIHVDGYRLRTHGSLVRRRMMLLEDPEKHDCNAVDAIIQAVVDYGIDRPGLESEVADWFERLELVGSYGTSARCLSQGQRFKVSMICLFVVCPSIWLLDEPFSRGLDAGGVEILEMEMKQHTQGGGIVIFSSQWPEHANRLADRAIVLHRGRLVHTVALDQSIDERLIRTSEPSLAAVLAGLGRHA